MRSPSSPRSPAVELGRRFPHPALLSAIAAAWVAAVAAEATGRGASLHHDALAGGEAPAGAALVLFLLAWQLMIVAMMLPSSLPLVRLFAVAGAREPRPALVRGAFLGGYAAVWTAFGAAAFLGDVAVHAAVERSAWIEDRSWALGGGVLLLAGVFQFSALKDRCVRICRDPAGFLARHYAPGAGAGFRLGARHGVFCLGCCWALMLVMFAVGVANVAWMATLTAVMVLEKTVPDGRRAVRPVGLALVAAGALMLSAGAW
jgi:predicted metal-binding membrane protein